MRQRPSPHKNHPRFEVRRPRPHLATMTRRTIILRRKKPQSPMTQLKEELRNPPTLLHTTISQASLSVWVGGGEIELVPEEPRKGSLCEHVSVYTSDRQSAEECAR